jgi:hypothetical protein
MRRDEARLREYVRSLRSYPMIGRLSVMTELKGLVLSKVDYHQNEDGFCHGVGLLQEYL